MRVRVEEISAEKVDGAITVKVGFTLRGECTVESHETVYRAGKFSVYVPLERFSEGLMLEYIKTGWKASGEVMEKVKQIAQKILGKEYEVEV